MRTYFVSRHAGAIDWLKSQGYPVDKVIPHIENVTVQPGDMVIGTLPVNLIAEVVLLGARYLHINLDLPASARGRELNLAEMLAYNAQLQEFYVERKHA